MTISVIVPIYKVEAYLRQCVDSILAQTYTDLDIVLVDDGSTDNCPAICDAYARKDARVQVVHKPNDIVDQYGADTMRLYIMFIGDFEKAATWSNDAVKGSKRFLDRVWNLAESASDSYDVTPANEAIIHKTIKKVTEDIDSLKMNTAIAAMMTMVNELSANGCTRGDLKYLILLLNPFAPHITEELWENLGFAAQTGKMCCQAEWPVADESKTVAATVEMAVQVNGKLKGTISMPTDSGEQAVVDAALAVEKVAKATEGMQIVKTILVKNRLVNLIVKPR